MSRNRIFQVLTIGSLLTLLTLTAPGADFGSAMGLYQKGDYPAAMKEFTVLAGQGDADAQLILGDMYAQGQGVAQDHVQAYKWYEIASHNGAKDAPAARDALKNKMSAEDVKKAEQLAQEWRPDSITAEGGTGTAPPSPPPATPAASSSGGFFKNLARTVTGLAGGPGAASSTSTSVSGIRGLDAEGLRAASPDLNALKKMEGYASSAGDATGFAQNAKLVAQNVPYIEIQEENTSTQPVAPQSFGSH
jgi:TPR repeat protein